jgi:hypothetical protein
VFLECSGSWLRTWLVRPAEDAKDAVKIFPLPQLPSARERVQSPFQVANTKPGLFSPKPGHQPHVAPGNLGLIQMQVDCKCKNHARFKSSIKMNLQYVIIIYIRTGI